MENLCEFSSRLRSDYDQCSAKVSKIAVQKAFVCSLWLCQNHAKRFAKEKQSSCCYQGESCCNRSHFSPCPRQLINVLSELPQYNGGTFLCKKHLDFLDKDPQVTFTAVKRPEAVFVFLFREKSFTLTWKHQ